MSLKRTQPSVRADDPFPPGVYLTDGSSLFNVVGDLPYEPSLRLVEDCSTLEILMVHVDGLHAPGVRRVYATSQQELDQSEPDACAADAKSTSLARVARR